MKASINWDNLLRPESVGVIGASNTRGSWGYAIMQGLLATGKRRIYPVNPKAGEVLGVKAYRSVTEIPDTLDLAVIVVNAELVPKVLSECAQKSIKTVSIISAGFAETGNQGQILESECVRIAEEAGIRFIGPNSMGHANTRAQLSTFGQPGEMLTGPVSLLSQSGSMSLSVVRSAMEYGINFSKYISTGNEADIHLEDYLEYLASDEDTRIIALYIEGLREGRRFFRIAKEVSADKPIVAIKIGGTEQSAKAVRSHTGALAGSDPIYTAAFKQSGVIRVEDDEELCDVIFALLNSPLPSGNKVGVLSIGGGPGALAAEACEKEGMSIGTIAPETVSRLDTYLPPRWSRRNPVDMAGISASEYPSISASLYALLDDENIDMVFLQAPILISREHLTKRLGLNPEEIKAYREKEKGNLTLISQKVAESGKPVILLGQAHGVKSDPELSSMLSSQKILVCSNARRAARIIRYLLGYKNYLNSL